jgi:hypothetical protein
MDGIARKFGLDNPPIVPVVREVSPEELFPLIDECMARAGFPPLEPGTWSTPEDQFEAFESARFTCFAQYPIKVELDQPITASQALFIRNYWITSWIPCVQDRGITLDPPPTEQTLLDNWHSPEAWFPSVVLHDLHLDQARTDEILTACPEFPPMSQVVQH